MPKRGENIYKRKDGRWEGRIKQSTELFDREKYHSIYGKTYGEVKKKMLEARKEVPSPRNSSDLTMEEAVNIWFADKKDVWKESTYATYRQLVEKYILPRMGCQTLHRIDNPAMSRFAAEIQAENTEQTLSRAHLFYVCNIVIRIMSYIRKKMGIALNIPENPIHMERKPRVTLPDEKDLIRLEAYLLKNLHDDTCLGVLVALHTGLRIGELCALKWENIDLEAGLLHIRDNVQRVKNYEEQENKTKMLFSSPKTSYSVRDIPIPPALSNVLEGCRKAPSAPLIGGVRGIWMDPRTLQYRFRKILENCDIDYFKFHMLRHAFATRCIEKGFDSKSLSEILGHSSIQITLNLYVHSTIQQKKRLMNLMGTYSE